MQPAKLVAVGIAEIGKIKLAVGIFAIAGRVFTRLAAGRDAALVPGVDLLRSAEVEPDSAAVGMMRGLPVDRFADHEHRAILAIGNAALVVGPAVLLE